MRVDQEDQENILFKASRATFSLYQSKRFLYSCLPEEETFFTWQLSINLSHRVQFRSGSFVVIAVKVLFFQVQCSGIPIGFFGYSKKNCGNNHLLSLLAVVEGNINIYHHQVGSSWKLFSSLCAFFPPPLFNSQKKMHKLCSF